MRRTILIVLVMSLVGWSAPRALAKVDFQKQIKPIFEASCVSCHNPKKIKGKLRLDEKALAMKGTPDGPVIVPGMADKSPMYKRVSLPADDPDIMPAKGDLLTKEQQALIRDWINEGAEWPDGVKLVVPGGSEGPVDPIELKGVPITDAEKAAVSKIEQQGALAMRIAQDTNWLRADYSLHAKDTKDADLAALKDVTNLYELDLGGTKVTDAGLASLSEAVNLHRLSLEKTAVTGAGLANLKNLKKLSYLNLYGTQVDDKAIENLAALKGLKKVYLWQSKVSEDGAKKLAKALPEVYINLGWDKEVGALPEPPEPKVVVKDPNAPEFKIAEIMEKAHKDGLAKKATEGKASPEELKQLVAYYTALTKNKPPKGDEADWKTRTGALLSAATLLEKGDQKGQDALKTALDCKACHSLHKP
jgi:Planctomycete cytochrome C